jgi:hypothetical protein
MEYFLAAFFEGNNYKLPRKGSAFPFTVGSSPQKNVQKSMDTPWYMPHIFYVVGKQWGWPVVVYCSPNCLQDEAALPPDQIKQPLFLGVGNSALLG